MMKALIDFSVVDKIKDALRTSRVRDVPPRHRIEAIARGLGWNSHAALRAEASGCRVERDVSDRAFLTYLAEKGFNDIESETLSRAVGQSTFAVSFSGRFPTVHAPYQVSPFVLTYGPSARLSPAALNQVNLELNGGRDPADFFGGPDDKFAEVSKHFRMNMVQKHDLEGEDFLFRVLSAHRLKKMH